MSTNTIFSACAQILFRADRMPPPDADGFFSHPDLECFSTDYDGLTLKDPGDEGIISDKLLSAVGFESRIVELGDDVPEDHPAYIRYFETGGCGITDWTPTQPEGEGWRHVGSWDTEDGPVAMFVRPRAPAPATTEESSGVAPAARTTLCGMCGAEFPMPAEPHCYCPACTRADSDRISNMQSEYWSVTSFATPTGMGDYNRKAQIKAATNLPAPRLQLRWETSNGTKRFPRERYPWACFYELVIPLRDGDIRRDEGAGKPSASGQLTVRMGVKTLRGSDQVPMHRWPTNELFADAPYRDGRHAEWDAAALGGIPIYVIGIDGRAMLMQTETEDRPNG